MWKSLHVLFKSWQIYSGTLLNLGTVFLKSNSGCLHEQCLFVPGFQGPRFFLPGNWDIRSWYKWRRLKFNSLFTCSIHTILSIESVLYNDNLWIICDGVLMEPVDLLQALFLCFGLSLAFILGNACTKIKHKLFHNSISF